MRWFIDPRGALAISSTAVRQRADGAGSGIKLILCEPNYGAAYCEAARFFRAEVISSRCRCS